MDQKQNIKVAAAPGDKQMVASMCRALYPHDRFPDKIYMDVAEGAIKKGNASPGMAMMMRTGLNDLKEKSFNKMSFKKQTKYLKKLKDQLFLIMLEGILLLLYMIIKKFGKYLVMKVKV